MLSFDLWFWFCSVWVPTQILASSSDPLPFHPHPACGESSLTMGGCRQFTMDICSPKTHVADASLNVTFSSCCSFSSVILHLLYYEFLPMTLLYCRDPQNNNK